MSALSKALELFVEPVAPAASGGGHGIVGVHPVVAVVGLAPGVGTTTVARSVGACLARRQPTGAAVVTASGMLSSGIPLAGKGASGLARAVARRTDAPVRPVGRLCLLELALAEDRRVADYVRELAPVIFDVVDPSEAPTAASLADAVVLVGDGDTEAALADLVADSLRRVGPEPTAVRNRYDAASGDTQRWDARLPESRVGARLAVAGRAPRGDLGSAIADLVERLALEPLR